MLDLLRQFGIEPKKVSSTKGGEYHSPCPKCGGDDRFHVWPEQNSGVGSFWCRGCGVGGDKIEFLRKIKGFSFRDAAAACGKDLKPQVNQVKPYRPAGPAVGNSIREFTPAAHPPPNPLWQEKCGKLAARCHEMLFSDYPQILTWLQERGIDAAAARAAGLGWNPGDKGRDLYRARKAWGAPEVLKADGAPKKLWLPVGLTIPLYADDGSLLRLRIRRPTADNLPRYVVIPGSAPTIMQIGPDRQAQVVVESELDAILIAARTSAGAVALGSVSIKPDARAHRTLKNAIQVLLALDSDPAGAKATPWWLANYPRCDRWPVPVGKDPGEAYAAGCDLAAWVGAGLPPVLTLQKNKITVETGFKPVGTKPVGTKPVGTVETGLKPVGTKPVGTVETGLKPVGTKPGCTVLTRDQKLDLFLSAMRYV